MPAIWDRSEALIDRAPGLDALRAHRLQLMAARIWRARGLRVPDELRAEELRAWALAAAAPPLLERARTAYDGRLMLMKGPEVAARYPEPSDRQYCDLDLLADDAPAAQRSLIAAGFVELGNPTAFDQAQHLCPLIWPGLPLVVELHRRASQPWWLPAVAVTELLQYSIPSATGVDGLLAPSPAAHALLLTAHSWSHLPLRRLADLIDVAAVLNDEDGRAADQLADAWGWAGMWRVMDGAVSAMLGGGPVPVGLRVWGRHLGGARERAVIENHLARISAPACSLPPRMAARAVVGVVRRTAGRRSGERWPDTLHRSRLAIAHAFTDSTKHERGMSQAIDHRVSGTS